MTRLCRVRLGQNGDLPMLKPTLAMPPQALPGRRLWRVRKRHDHLDAVLQDEGSACDLQYLLNDRPLVSWRFGDRDGAIADADSRRQELQQAGWTLHW